MLNIINIKLINIGQNGKIKSENIKLKNEKRKFDFNNNRKTKIKA